MTNLDKILGILNAEAKQEQETVAGDNLLLKGIDSNLLRGREEEYRDTEKQWVRREVWLKAAKAILKKKNQKGDNGGIRYLTLPAYHRLDVSLFLKEGLLQVTKSNGSVPEEVYVAAFERDPSKFALMQAQVPHFKFFGCDNIEKALTDPANKYFSELKSLFPFDIVNLDLTTSLTPEHEGPYSTTMRAIDAIFDIQSAHGLDWAFFLTFRNVPNDLEDNTRKQLFNNLQANIEKHAEVLEAFQNRYGKHSVDDLQKSDIKTCISQSIAKWLVDRAHQHKYKVSSIKPFFYSRYNHGVPPYQIYKHVLLLEPGNINPAYIPTKQIPEQAWMTRGLIGCVEQHYCTDVEGELLGWLEKAPEKYQAINDEVVSLSRMV